jgi:RND superfamily putative drug exporter
MVIAPAVVTLLGDRAWWLPGWLDRVLPNISLEGRRDAAEGETEETIPDREAVPA